MCIKRLGVICCISSVFMCMFKVFFVCKYFIFDVSVEINFFNGYNRKIGIVIVY